MLIEKIGYTNFKIKGPKNGSSFIVDSSKHSTSFQLKQMSFQPDFILEFAHYLGDIYSTDETKVEVYAESYVALNGGLAEGLLTQNLNYIKKKNLLKTNFGYYH